MHSDPDLRAFSFPHPYNCRIMFVEPQRGGVMVDFVTVSASGDVDPGTPFAVEFSLPSTAWAMAAAGTLAMWAEQQTEVALLFERSDGSRLRIADGSRSLRLDRSLSP